MRLLNVNTRQLEEFFGDTIPSYAILSHTWGKEEVTLQDLSREGHQQKQGYAKIEGCCQQAIKDGYLWVWVDTCCIDKTSSAELSEAINSMFRWYKNSKVCYAYLQDVPTGSDIYEQGSAFRKSRWFTRGWTLQELIAPQKTQFYDSSWTLISQIYRSRLGLTGEKMITLLSEITSIEGDYLIYHWRPQSVSAAHIFSWMARRSTTRVEDEAYCLLGLLDINIPLLYGEGEKAFIRLQEAVFSGSDDKTPLSWGYGLPCADHESFLARSPGAFARYPKGPPKGHFHRTLQVSRTHTTVTGLGLHIELFMFPIESRENLWVGVIEDSRGYGLRNEIGIILKEQEESLFTRAGGCVPFVPQKRSFNKRLARPTRRKRIYIAHKAQGTNNSIMWSFVSRFNLTPFHWDDVELSFTRESGCWLSNSWPSVVTRLDEDSGERSVICFGPHTSVFYMIFLHHTHDRFAVRLRICWGLLGKRSLEIAFCKLDARYRGTALEHCCGARIGSVIPRFAKDMRWSPYLAAKNMDTDEDGHLYATKVDERLFCSSTLMWKKGPYLGEGSTSASHDGGP